MFTAMLILSMGLSGIPEAPVAAWEFNSPGEVQPWRANSHMSHVLPRTASWHATPLTGIRSSRIPRRNSPPARRSSWCSASGPARRGKAAFWTAKTEGQYGGFDPSGDEFHGGTAGGLAGDRHSPFWHAEARCGNSGSTSEGAHFEVDWLRVYDCRSAAPAGTRTAGTSTTAVRPGGCGLEAARWFLRRFNWTWRKRVGLAHAQSRCGHHGVAVLGQFRRVRVAALSFEVPASADFRVCDIELQGESAWRGAIVASASRRGRVRFRGEIARDHRKTPAPRTSACSISDLRTA